MSFKIISCDGGGIRGLLSAMLIQDLDEKFQIIQKADGFAGTSTGGLLALAMAHGVPIAKLIELYKNSGAEIFKQNHCLLVQGATEETEHKDSQETLLRNGPGKICCQYKSDGLKKIAQELFSDRLLSSSERFVVINSMQLWDEGFQSWIPCTFSNLVGNPFRDITMVDAALATSAAPTYFPPHRVKIDAKDLGYFADGGVFANNPAMTAFTEIIFRKVSDQENIKILSVGTGNRPTGILPADIDNSPGGPLFWGADYWLWPKTWGKKHTVPSMALLELTMDASAELATFQADQILGERFQRANFMLSKQFDLDGWKQVASLAAEVQQYLKTPAWKDTCDWVEQHWK